MNLKGFRTLLFGLLNVVLGFLEYFDWTEIFGQNGWIIGVIGLLIMYLRKVTDGPMGSFGLSTEEDGN
ncbi:hypothetical protein PP178_04305 [Zeaxanthinibacter sp. PT1]|uniref:hypothetical protein n=1 Tax=Zeaxanthinibacter TaxID=561554 RepID=UPI002349B605|nr:hypothetical protein [Zeaxanthinibacter sp. PT1]MDC6350762.1 hypothetical protein [Zeaxanthinibacter sp. PT1]